MLVDDEGVRDVEETMRDIDQGKREHDSTMSRATKLENELRRMTQQAKSIERGGDRRRIRKFNQLFIQKTSELSRIRQTTGNSSREKAAELVDQALAE